ncbi:MAG TPA: class I SAM-dependent methyltransferase [Vicinamibacterales bacterium]|nr:class I SAM-dependent methyltransferase [Vicinamibacterales bacterium]HOQ61325.1 class I SAM-dependent methyltransferase [Vicinamibacterales bacterium]HPK71376.1 class I SAM-dependent methyltransferase [Vicinamibacterales bacterium]
MALTREELTARAAHFWRRTAHYRGFGYDRVAASEAIVAVAGPLDAPVLDVGTGMGLAARALAARGLEVVSVDTNAEDQQVAAALTDDPALLGRIQFTLADAARLPFAAGRFGSVVTVDVLHHLDDGSAVLAEIVRILRPGGTLVLSDFSREGFDLVARVHALEGRVHPEGPVTMAWAREHARGLGLIERAAFVTCLHDVSVFRAAAA